MKLKNRKNECRFRAVLAALVCGTLLLTACGGASSGGGSASAEPQETAGQKQEAAGQKQETTEKTQETAEAQNLHHAEISVEGYGTITVALDEDAAPVTVGNFIKLADAGFYDGLTFHRIMDGFMIQGGDPNGNGTGGSGETIVGEFASNGHENPISHRKGVISMARAKDPDSASSQFFITVADAVFLDGEYAAFGYVTDGIEIVEKIAKDAEPVDKNGTIPAQAQPVINSIRITD